MQALIAKIAACLVAAAASGVHAAPIATAAAQPEQPLPIPSLAGTIVGVDPTVIAARQAIFEGLLANAQQQPAVADAHTAYATLATAATPADPSEVATAAESLMASVLAHYATAPDADQQVQQLRQSNAQFAAAAAQAEAKREEECDMLTSFFNAQYGKVSQATKDCICDNTKDYVVCRSKLANDLNTQTIQTMQSTITDKRMQRIAYGHPGAMNVPMADPAKTVAVNNTWQPDWMRNGSNANVNAAAAPSLLSRRQATAELDPSKGEFTAGGCIPVAEELPIELCVTTTASVPAFSAAQDAGGNVVVSQLNTDGSSKSTALFDFLAETAKGTVEDSKIELDISLCMGIPGLSEVLNDVGISLCLDLFRTDMFFLQGPVSKVSVGLDLAIVSFAAWYKYKYANGAPLCPQDFSYETMQHMCQNRQVFDAVVSSFQDEDFCNLDAGQGIFGATVTLDLFLYQKSWDFGQTPEPREAPKCNEDSTPMMPGFQPGKFDGLDCADSRVAYLQANNDVLQNWAKPQCYNTNNGQDPSKISDAYALKDPCVQVQARNHWMTNGKSEGRQWPGRACYREDVFCWAAQEEFWGRNPDAADSDMYGPDQVLYSTYGGVWDGNTYYVNNGTSHNATAPRDGAWRYFLANQANNPQLIWRGDLCNLDDFNANKAFTAGGEYGSATAPTIDLAHAQAYFTHNGVAATVGTGAGQPSLMHFTEERYSQFFDSSYQLIPQNVYQDWYQFGKYEGLWWPNSV